MVLKPINRKETALYLGYGKHEPDEIILKMMDDCEGPLMEAARPAYAFGVFDTIVCSEERIALSECTLELTGKDIGKLLRNCGKAVLFAATLGSGVDALIRRLQVNDMPKALITDAMAGAAIEQICNDFQAELAARFPGTVQTMRYSPGYGDLPLSLQKDLLAMLEAGKRIGLTVTDGSMLTPVKSVTAIIGLRDADSEEEALKLKDRMAAADDFTAELSVGNCGKEACQGCAFHDRCHKAEKEDA